MRSPAGSILETPSSVNAGLGRAYQTAAVPIESSRDEALPDWARWSVRPPTADTPYRTTSVLHGFSGPFEFDAQILHIADPQLATDLGAPRNTSLR